MRLGVLELLNMKKTKPYIILGSLQAHANKQLVEGGVCPCIGTTDLGLPKLIEISERAKSNGKYKQRIEMGDNISNTITSVQKDALVAEPKIINPLKGKSSNGWHFEQQVYDEEGITRAVKAGEGSGNIPKVIVYDDYNQRIPKDQDTIGTITCQFGNSTPRHGYKIIEPQVLAPKRTEFGKQIRKQYEQGELESSRHDMTTMEPREDGVALPCAREHDNLDEPKIIQKCGDRGTSNYSESPIAYTIPANPMSDRGQLLVDPLYRIRKLTPRECFRLMGVDDADIDKIQASGISKTAQYKLAGNSIVVDVLYHIFRKMFVEKGIDKTDKPQQLSLF